MAAADVGGCGYFVGGRFASAGWAMTLAEFERCSASVKALNPHLFGAPARPECPGVAPPPSTGAPPYCPTAGRRMNRTERDFGAMLEAQRRRGEIVRYEYEGITLRWGGGMRYTPDFVVVQHVPHPLKFVEIKGGRIWDRDIVRFKGAAAYWPQFEFEMWQKQGGRWCRLH